MNNSRSGGGVVLAASGAGGDHPGGGGGRKGMDGHYSSDPGEFKPLPPGIKMAQEPRARPQRRQRAMSLPNAMDLGFYGTMRSVLTHGILPQPVMRERGIGFSPSHDGNRRESNEVEVTRVPRVDDVRQQRGIVRRAVENPYHGSLTVALERSSEVQYRPQSDHEVRSGMSLDQRFAMLGMPDEDVRGVINARRGNVLGSQQSVQDANRRMHGSFSVLAPSSEQPNQNQPYEATRGSIRPQDMREVHVPFQHLPDARRVLQDMRRSGQPVFPQLVGVHDTQNLAPRYNTRRGDAVDTTGVTAPAYHDTLFDAVGRLGAVDQHLVRTPVRGNGGALAPMPQGGGRKRSNTI